MEKLLKLIFLVVYSVLMSLIADYALGRLDVELHWIWDTLIGILLSPLVLSAAVVIWFFEI